MVIYYALAFLAGAIPTAYWYAKLFHGMDIRQHGSGNIGATNSMRVIGKKAGAIVLLFDFMKGFLPVFIMNKMGYTIEESFIVGIFSILGHIFSPFVGFKGGKGIASAFGVITGVFPVGALVCLAVFVITVYVSKYVSLGSIIGSLAFAVYCIVENPNSTSLQMLSVALCVILVYTHRLNIKRILNKTESKVGKKKE